VGVDDRHPPFFQAFGKLAAVMSLVSQAEFCGSAGEANLQNLAWLAPRACRHQAVVEEVMNRGPVLPARFGTLFSSRASLETYLREHEEVIGEFLENVRDREEWAVKGFLDPARAEAALLAGLRPGADRPPGTSPGLAYLQEERLQITAKQELEERVAAASDELWAELSPVVSAAHERRLLTRETTGETRDMVFNWAFLVPQAVVAELRGRIERANAGQKLCGLAFELSGPWPPYSFRPSLGRDETLEVENREGA
jgi:hypothetical protein